MRVSLAGVLIGKQMTSFAVAGEIKSSNKESVSSKPVKLCLERVDGKLLVTETTQAQLNAAPECWHN